MRFSSKKVAEGRQTYEFPKEFQLFRNCWALFLKNLVFHFKPSVATFTRESVNSGDREDVSCADRESTATATATASAIATANSLSLSHSHTPIHEGIHTGGRREAPSPCVEAARSAASFMDGCVAVAVAVAVTRGDVT